MLKVMTHAHEVRQQHHALVDLVSQLRRILQPVQRLEDASADERVFRFERLRTTSVLHSLGRSADHTQEDRKFPEHVHGVGV